MATHTRFVCQSCGSVYSKWQGKCEACGEWNTMQQESDRTQAPLGKVKKSDRTGQKVEFAELKGASLHEKRLLTGIPEFDRVCGGGLVAGSALLIGGDPGIGKSTLLLQVAALASAQVPVAYISGEEAIDQIRMRAQRLGVSEANVSLAAATNMRDILDSLDNPNAPALVVIDSIQTMYFDNIESAPGTVTQVRATAQELVRMAKRRGFCVILVGHVTKDGLIAGPRVLEHMVDTVLYFEGERGHLFRILRSHKNRFGGTDEIGVFEMTDKGLQDVVNPSAFFLDQRAGDVSGTVVFAGMEGTRPFLVEVQALIAPSPYATPKRTVVGCDPNRLSMILAVLEARGGLQFSGKDVYLNIAGGFRVQEPASDLAVAAALISSLLNIVLPTDLVMFGEIGLTGEVRPSPQMDNRIKESEKLGFMKIALPDHGKIKKTDKLTLIKDIGDLIRFVKKQ